MREGKRFSDKPVVLDFYSATCPDLTLIDLPGTVRTLIDEADKEVENGAE